MLNFFLNFLSSGWRCISCSLNEIKTHPHPFQRLTNVFLYRFFPETYAIVLKKVAKVSTTLLAFYYLVIMPPSVLEVLSRLNVQYPMLFKLTNAQANRTTHCGVLEFVADEGNIYVPYWMLRNLLLEEGGLVWVTNAALPVASFAKFQPQSTDFLDISNPKAVLENLLRDFACLTVGDVIAINYNERMYELKVLETQPEDAVSIIECDMRVDFAPPVGYEEHDNRSTAARDKQPKQHEEDEEIFVPNVNRGFQVSVAVVHLSVTRLSCTWSYR
ncbi:hypothetical protein P879_09807 [Paragonimus westermani]|uniref:Ubiquitin fusion degradation protein 1 n=1 Tax=Paragonimus westermani TaxID=34504 RepID=A0A8T0D907_9TREM|nr:hypothetical protein P879_09807 [Paragonimus westermani]